MLEFFRIKNANELPASRPDLKCRFVLHYGEKRFRDTKTRVGTLISFR